MYFKKAICGLMSVGILSGCLFYPASAENVKKILSDPKILKVDEITTLVRGYDFNKFIDEEELELFAKPHSVEDTRHLDSVMFWCLCILSYKNKLSNHIEDIVRCRNWAELKRDNTVFKYFKREIATKLKVNFGIAGVTRDEFEKIYSVIMNKPLELRVQAGRDVTYTHTVARGLQLRDKKIKKRPMWKAKKKEARNNRRAALIREFWWDDDDV